MDKHVIGIVAGLAFAIAAQAQTPTLSPQARFASDRSAAAERFASDKVLCKDETTAKARLECRREAKAQYDAAIADAKARLAAANGQVPAAAAQAACVDCGRVSEVSIKQAEGKGSPVGLIAGGVGGALLGHQLGGGAGKDIATIAGAVGGAYAGKKIEEKVTARNVWHVTVAYPDNTRKTFLFEQDPGFKVGDPVRNSGASIVRQ